MKEVGSHFKTSNSNSGLPTASKQINRIPISNQKLKEGGIVNL